MVGGRGRTHGPETLEVVEVDIVLADFIEDTHVALCVVKGQSGRVSERKLAR